MRVSNIIRSASALAVVIGVAAADQSVRLEGRVSRAGTNLVFEANPGKRYELKRTRNSEALFLDTNLLARVLVVSGKVEGKSFEITSNLRSIKDGELHEVFYYCDICAITSNLPELCQCCREPTVLREEPVE
jgi:hypothetical protein